MSHNNNNHNNGGTPVNVRAEMPQAVQEKRDNPHDVRPEHIANHPAAAEAAVPAAEPQAAAKEKERVILQTDAEDETPDLVVELSKVYAYDDEEIDKIDLTGIDNISNKDQSKAMKLYRKNNDNISSTPEFTPEYAVAITHVLTGIPLEIIKQFSFRDKIKLRNAVMAFLYN